MLEAVVIAALAVFAVFEYSQKAQNGRFQLRDSGAFDTRTGQVCYPLSVRPKPAKTEARPAFIPAPPLPDTSLSPDIPLCKDLR